MPQKICFDCSDNIKAACDVKSRCIDTDQLLRGHLVADSSSETSRRTELNSKARRVNQEVGSKVRTESEEPEVDLNYETFSVTVTSKVPNSKMKKIVSRTSKTETPVTSTTAGRICNLCQAVFPSIQLKRAHLVAVHQRELVCRTCGTKRASVIAIDKCMHDDRVGFPFLCQVCAKGFRTEPEMKKHQATVHKTDSEFVKLCDLCGFRSAYSNTFRNHMIGVHLRVRKKYPCPYPECLASDVHYTTSAALKIHSYRCHNLPAPVVCPLCRKGYNLESELKRHRVKCTGDASPRVPNLIRSKNRTLDQFFTENDEGFHCKVCLPVRRVYKSRINWSSHYNAYHLDNKTCKICDIEFSCHINFRRHQKNVHEDKSAYFQCPFPGCGKAFNNRGYLKNHQNLHLGLQPYSCGDCGFKSAHSSMLRKHRPKCKTNVK